VANDGRIERAADVLRRVGVEGPIDLDPVPLLQAVADHLDDVTVTRHPLGFLHADLSPFASLAQDERLRLHIWTEESRAFADNLGVYHDHVWEGRSFIITGCVTNSLMRVVRRRNDEERDAGERFTMSEVTYLDGRQFIEVIDKDLELEEIDRRRAVQGSSYFLPRRVVHATEIGALPTATIVLAKCFSDGARPRLVSPLVPDPAPRVRPTVLSDELRSALSRVTATLGHGDRG
jgi:hypothetical protein